ncbi:sterile alpha motif domain-containing protein 9-like [Sphaeramia orbicularis]|uniref:Sterile alpha motif domain-containing protein 9-like n=1 Tax=Sphaeramia orbicularis TaxID=375764 RepID=A0A672YWK1_9TELE|nr:sterile alpha motif domain-containing protein 9-like [Sphaeramia orbicularis]XP_029981422.1 sterile alpha motif domain-containing protein 9-like [Sphaeramia orbicularis]
MADQGEMKDNDQDLSPDMKHWSKQQVREWVLKLEGVDDKTAETLFLQDITGPSLLLLEVSELKEMGVTFGPAKLIIHARDELIKLKKDEPTSFANQSGRPCKPYPFHRYHDTYRYIEGNILDIPESGASGLIEPCHEYKSFINTTDETKMDKFTSEIIRFAAACMNSCTNGTIHFGIGDKPEGFTHGQVLGVVVDDKEAYGVELKSEIDCYFEHKHKLSAQKCIKPPRFVGVLNKDMMSSNKCVIEVDIVPDSTICGENFYHTYSMSTKKKKTKVKETVTTETNPSKQFFVRDGGSSRNLFPHTTSAKDAKEYNDFIGSVEQRAQLRKQAEEKHLRVIKSSNQGSKLSQMITGGTASLDKSHYERYVIVTNKSHSVQFESLGFLVELNPTAVLDFDPQSAQNGLQQYFEKQSPVTVHLPDQYKITGDVEDIANNLQLTRNTSWVFCNGKIGEEEPSEINHWMMDKGASIRGVTSFLCRKDVLPNKRFLVVFLLLSTVSDTMDPLVETFSTFLQELKGTEQILCICDNKQAFTSWRDLIQARCGIDVSSRCIYELSLSEVNGTVLSLWSENRRSSRFLPCGGGGKVILEKKIERSLNTLDVLCVNQCEGGNEDKIAIEENFYKGGKVSWWNFFFSEQPGSTPFIKRDKFAYITDTVIPELCSERKACMLLNLIHIPGCGGTTLAMHTLWALRDRFRCAVLLDNNADFAKVADQVVTLLSYKCEEQLPHVPVLLMVDDFDEMERVFDLQQLIENECVKRQSQSKSAQVILLNCMRSESSEHDQKEPTKDTVFIGNKLSEEEQKQFEQKYVEIEKTHTNAETFYGFMIMKKNLEEGYIQSVACNTLKSFNIDQKSAQLLAVLVLLSAYCNRATVSVSLCEEFLGLQPKPFCGTIKVEEGFGKFSTLITCCEVVGKVVFKAIKLIHSKIAWHCLQELAAKHNTSKAKITDFLLTTNELYGSIQGKDKLMQDVRNILVKRYSLKEESQVQATAAIPAGEKDEKKSLETRFSPLIRHIENETPGLEERVLINASHRFQKDAVIAQLLARYYYLKKKDFEEAKQWAKTAKNLSKDSSYISDTAAQVIKHELKTTIGNEKVPIGPEALGRLLKLAKSATDSFRETQNLAKAESTQRLQTKAGNYPFNTAGYLGEIQVGVHVIEVLKKIPIFSAGNVRHDILSQMLSGSLTLDQIKQNDPGYRKNIQYYIILQSFKDVLYSLKCRMKTNFDFLDKFYVNLGSKFGMEETREQITQNELFRCFKQYAELFCKTDSAALLKNKTMHRMLQLHQARQYLEMQKADTYSGILNYLSKDAKDVQPAILEKIAKRYEFICTHEQSRSVERINYIYVNVVLSCIKLESDKILPYQELVNILCQILHKPISLDDSLPLLFIAVVLLWPQQYLSRAESGNLGKHISQMRTCYHTVMKEVYSGKRPIIHFFLGKKQGYERLVHLGQVKSCIKAGKEQFASMWENGLIWKNTEVKECLYRVSGEVRGRNILANTLIPNLKIEVTPMFQSQLRNLSDGSKVSFFIGFSMKGPLAIDIY